MSVQALNRGCLLKIVLQFKRHDHVGVRSDSPDSKAVLQRSDEGLSRLKTARSKDATKSSIPIRAHVVVLPHG
jgi:hypothetical protein